MLNLFTRIASTWSAKPQKPLKILTATDDAFSLVEHSQCYQRELDLTFSVRLRLKEADPSRRFYLISQLQSFAVNGAICQYETPLGSLEIFYSPQKAWLRWSNQLFQLSLYDLNYFIHSLENAHEDLKRDFANQILEGVPKMNRPSM
jgi:hypothetical protein